MQLDIMKGVKENKMTDYLAGAKEDFERSQGDVTDGHNKMLKEYAKIKALIAIAEELQRLNEKLDNMTNYSGNALFVEPLRK